MGVFLFDGSDNNSNNRLCEPGNIHEVFIVRDKFVLYETEQSLEYDISLIERSQRNPGVKNVKTRRLQLLPGVRTTTLRYLPRLHGLPTLHGILFYTYNLFETIPSSM